MRKMLASLAAGTLVFPLAVAGSHPRQLRSESPGDQCYG